MAVKAKAVDTVAQTISDTNSSRNTTPGLKPFLKWAGGKRQLTERLLAMMPEDFAEDIVCTGSRYYEPFLGSGALLFALQPKAATVCDKNPQLINAYLQLKLFPDEVISRLQDLDAEPCTAIRYAGLRAQYNRKIQYNELDTECAALLVWINKHCFNGLYRVNSHGFFNVPWNGRTDGPSADYTALRSTADWLQQEDIQFRCGDFAAACFDVRRGDLVYFDPPYVAPAPQETQDKPVSAPGYAQAEAGADEGVRTVPGAKPAERADRASEQALASGEAAWQTDRAAKQPAAGTRSPDKRTCFVSYTQDGFQEADQRRLAELFRKLDSRGAHLMLSNHDSPLVRELYSGFHFTKVDVLRSINRSGTGRTGTELVITNF